MSELLERINDLLTEFDEFGFVPGVPVPDPEALAIAWRDNITKAIEELSKQSEWISVEDDLPNEGEDLLIWIGSAKSARIRKGITEEERQKMRNGELPNPKNVYWCISQGDTLIERSEIYTSADVHGNNLVPYCWELDGGNTLFGQHVKYWKHQPQPPEMKGGAE